jgi:hypothetical protein
MELAEGVPSLDELPLYALPDEPDRRGLVAYLQRCWADRGTASTGWWAASPRPRTDVELRRSVVLVISRVIDVAPPDAVAAFERWAAADGALAVQVGIDELEVATPARKADAVGCLCSARCRLRRGRWPAQRLELEVVPWSGTRTELDLRPVGFDRRTYHYISVGHGLLDAVAARVMAWAAG